MSIAAYAIAHAKRPAAPRAPAAPRGPSMAIRFLADLIAEADNGNGIIADLPLAPAVRAWCYGTDDGTVEAHAPRTETAKTPHATLAKAGCLPSRVTITSAEANRAAGRAFERTISIM